jgi:ketosteroid isomerase-like protein
MQHDFSALTSRLHDGNAGTLNAVLAAIASKDLSSAAAHFHEQAVMSITGFPPFDGVFEGRDEILAALGRNFNAITNQRSELLSMSENGDSMHMQVEDFGRLIETGKSYEATVDFAFTFIDGRIASVREVAQVEFASDPVKTA